MEEKAKCEICGEPMPEGEESFKYHGYSGPCPKPPLPKSTEMPDSDRKWVDALKPYIGGGIVPFYTLPDGSVDAQKTIDSFCMLNDVNKRVYPKRKNK